MKTLILSFAAALLLSSSIATTTAKQDTQTEAYAASWAAYCAEYGINADTPTADDVDNYLDTWRGSVDEEKALTPEQNEAIN